MKLVFLNGQQFKAKVRNLAKEKQIDPQILIQEVALDEIVDRISCSTYRDNLILKGGFLIASMLGVDTRATRDVDTSVKGLPVTKEGILKVFTDIANINESDSDVIIRITKIDDIRVAADYAGFRIHIKTKIYNSVIDTKIDVSTGDTITPREISWHQRTIFNNQDILVMAYNMETILAEKLESIVVRQELNSRMKDFYDLYLFDKVQRQNIDFKVLKAALHATAEFRGSEALLSRYTEIITALRGSILLKRRWEKYQVAYVYSESVTYEATCDAALDLVNEIGLR